ncbi:MAG: sugar phosphate isomerase/epimerase [Candidatus Latescibacteria bacterium]|nr:sugar phosphate isomerase/epimerase [Candidatus Latescibacterota bacterium]MBT5830900.1 sugar phosphate isomerase/epimerase [Candidatus Latescibacterota bacterium]
MFKSLTPGAIGVKGSVEELIALASNGGFQGLDISIQAVADLVAERGANDVREMFASANLKVGAWGLPVNWNGPEDVYLEGLKDLAKLAKIAAEVGATRCAQWIPCASDTLKFRENFRFHIQRLKPIAEVLKDHGCSIGLEFIGPQTLRIDKPYGFIYTMDGMLALSEAIGTGNVGLLLDAWHWYTQLGTVSDLMALTPEDVIHVHVNDAPAGVEITDQIDNIRALPSETGVIDLVSFLKAMKAIGYEGPVSPEPFSQRVRELPAEQAIEETHAGLDKAWRTAGLA